MITKSQQVKELKNRFGKSFRNYKNFYEVTTDEIIINYYKKKRNFGELIVRIYKDEEKLDDSTPIIQVYSEKIKGIPPHPHVGRHDGSICLGDYNEYVEKCIYNGLFVDAFEYIIHALGTYTRDEGYRSILKYSYCEFCGDVTLDCNCEKKNG